MEREEQKWPKENAMTSQPKARVVNGEELVKLLENEIRELVREYVTVKLDEELAPAFSALEDLRVEVEEAWGVANEVVSELALLRLDINELNRRINRLEQAVGG